MNQKILSRIPGMTPEESVFVDNIAQSLSDEQIDKFIVFYGGSRKSPDQILLFCLLGLISVAGIHRFVLGNIGMGILYFFTGGLCIIGTIVDAVNHKKLANDYNYKLALQAKSAIGA
jgi:TM2 domain-containing membrane protein YozV